MTDYVWPDDLVPYQQSFYLQPHTGGSESPFSRATKAYGLSAERWVCTMAFRGGYWGSVGLEAIGPRLDAFIATLKGRQGRVFIRDFRRPPVRALASSAGVMNDAAPAGSTTIRIGGLTPGVVIRSGDYIGGDGRVHIVVDDATADGSGFATLNFRPALAAAIAANAIDLDTPGAWFRLTSDDAGSNATNVAEACDYHLEFVEDVPAPVVSASDMFASIVASRGGLVIDASDLANLWQDSAGTIPAAAGQPVGKAGTGYPVTATGTERPVLQYAADIGRYRLQFDDAGDHMVGSLPIEMFGGNLSKTGVAGTLPLDSLETCLFHYGEMTDGKAFILNAADSAGLPGVSQWGGASYDIAATIVAPGNAAYVFTAEKSGNTLTLWQDGQTRAGPEAKASADITSTTIHVGGAQGGNFWLNGYLYCLAIIPGALNSVDRGWVEQWAREKSGVYPHSGNFTRSDVLVVGVSGEIFGDPFIVRGGSGFILYYFHSAGSITMRYKTAATLKGLAAATDTALVGLDNYHKFVVLVDVYGYPVQIGGVYHGYASFAAGGAAGKEIFHFTASSLTGPWAIGSKVLAKGASGSLDGYFTDVPFALYKDGTIYLWYMGAPDTSQPTYGYAMRMLRATAIAPDGPFTKSYSDVLAPSTAANWDYGLMGGVQIRRRPVSDGYVMVYNAIDARPGSPGAEPNTSRIGFAYSQSIDGPWTRGADNPIASPEDGGPGAGHPYDFVNTWRGHVANDGGIWYLFYNSGSGTEVITYGTLTNFD